MKTVQLSARAQLLLRAERAIEDREEFVFDLAAENGQIFANVAHMRWFRREVANWLIRNVKKYQHLKEF